jgi:hypothetical protein
LFHLAACACCWSDHFVGFELLLGLLPFIAVSTCSSNHIDLQTHTNPVPENKNPQKEKKQPTKYHKLKHRNNEKIN